MLDCDFIIGADGIKSRVRRAVIPDEEIDPVSSANSAYRATVPAEVMRNDPDLKKLLETPNANCWIGYRRHVITYAIRKGDLINIVMSHPSPGGFASWTEPGNLEDLEWQCRNFDPVVRKLISKVDHCTKWKLAELEPLPTCISASGRVVLAGDAAHATLPYLAQGAAMAVEDGATLGECLDRCQDVKDLPRGAAAYESLRKRRCEIIVSGSHEHGSVWHLPDGEAQQERDAAMAGKKTSSLNGS